MKYADIRETIKSGDILAWSHHASPFASWYDFKIWFVRLWQRSEYSHVAVALRLAGRVFVLESVTGGIRLEPLSKFLPCYHLDFNELDDAKVERAMSVCGEPYSEIEAALGAFGQTDDTNGVWQCSEFVKWVHRLPCNATPADVVNYALAQGSTLKEIQP